LFPAIGGLPGSTLPRIFITHKPQITNLLRQPLVTEICVTVNGMQPSQAQRWVTTNNPSRKPGNDSAEKRHIEYLDVPAQRIALYETTCKGH
jgi:hypothetical protein